MVLSTWLWCIVLVFASSVRCGDLYTEALELRPFPGNLLLTEFTFITDTKGISTENYELFPRTLGKLIRETSAQELHLRFTQGWWDAESWGSPPGNGSHSGGSGVELWATISGSSLADATEKWTSLVNLLSGMFCASINFIDEANTVIPLREQAPGYYSFYGALPSEPVCTENLTPFLKLLPCKGKAGVGSLLDGHKIFDSEWQSMAIDVITENDSTTLFQTISAVIDVTKANRRFKSSEPRALQGSELRCDPTKESDAFKCFPLNEETENVHWKLSEIFGKNISGACLGGTKPAQVILHLAEEGGWSAEFMAQKKDLTTAAVSQTEFFSPELISGDIELKARSSLKTIPVSSPPVFVERAFTGFALDKGGIRTVFFNPLQHPVDLTYSESLPWYMRLYIHTLTTTDDRVIQDLHYRTSVDRKRPSQLEFELKIPSNSTFIMEYDFDKTLLYLAEYPPDANHGFNIAPGIVRTHDGLFEARTSSLLLTLPTPDFSMPYNVIIMTCTVLALGFGSIFNLLMKRVVTVTEAEEAAAASGLGNKIRKLGKLLKGEQSTEAQ